MKVMQDRITDLRTIEFPMSFFEDEVREGFLVTSMMKRYWACQLKVLSVIDGICVRHGLKWFADYGTLIGAVRHGGYIPWDDDLDICMFRSDWEKFFFYAKEELPKDYVIMTIRDLPGYEEVIGRVVNGNTINYSAEHLKEFYGCPYTVGVDIFPLDGIYDDEEKEKDRKERTKAVLARMNSEEGEKKRRDMLKAETLYMECPCEEAENLALMPFYIPSDNHIFPRKLYEGSVLLPFENTYVRVNARYDELLKIEYGDYMQVNKSGGMHNYPVYIDQEKILRDNLGRNPYRYTINYNELLRSVQRYVMSLTKGWRGIRLLQNTLDKMVLDYEESGDNKTESQSRIPVSNENGKGKTIVFLPCRANWWHTMEPLWRLCASMPDFEVHVMPIFYYDCDYNGNIGDRHDERHLFPEYVHAEDCEKFDFENVHPDVIVAQVPYDGWSTWMTVHEYFYSENLQKYTDELVYVPFFDIDDPVNNGDKASAALSVMIEQEMVINADRIIVSSDKLRNEYITRLLELCGADTKQYLEQKIVALDLKQDVSDGHIDDYSKIENRWIDLIGGVTDKKIMIYYISISFLLEGREKSIDKLRRSMDIFKENSEKIKLIFLPQEKLNENLKNIDENLWSLYSGFLAKVRQEDWLIYDEEGISLEYISKWNAYYGDPSPVVRKCVLSKIPVMLQNIEV